MRSDVTRRDHCRDETGPILKFDNLVLNAFDDRTGGLSRQFFETALERLNRRQWSQLLRSVDVVVVFPGVHTPHHHASI